MILLSNKYSIISSCLSLLNRNALEFLFPIISSIIQRSRNFASDLEITDFSLSILNQLRAAALMFGIEIFSVSALLQSELKHLLHL